MHDEMKLESKKLKILFVLALISAVSLSNLAEPGFAVAAADILVGKHYPVHGVMTWEIDTERCRYYDSEDLLPASYEKMFNAEGKDCAKPFEAAMLERRLKFINQTTESREVKKTVNKALELHKKHNFTEAHKLAKQIEVKRNYTVIEHN